MLHRLLFDGTHVSK